VVFVVITSVLHHHLFAFTRVTGMKAKYIHTFMEAYWKDGPIAAVADRITGYTADFKDPAGMTNKANFTAFLNLWKHSGDPKTAILVRDYTILDRIHPNRIRSAEQWFRMADKRGIEDGSGSLVDKVKNLKPALKSYGDIMEIVMSERKGAK
jgi:hypothetical protein